MEDVSAKIKIETILQEYHLQETTPEKVADKLKNAKWNYNARGSAVLVDPQNNPIIGIRRDKDGMTIDTVYLGPEKDFELHRRVMCIFQPVDVR